MGKNLKWKNVSLFPLLWKCTRVTQCVPLIHAQKKDGTDGDGEDTYEEMDDYSSMLIFEEAAYAWDDTIIKDIKGL